MIILDKRKIRSQSGFTMVELILVFALIAIIVTYAMGSSYMTSRKRARDAVRKSDLGQIAKALEAYVNDHRFYPPADANGKIICKVPTSTICDWGQEFSDENQTMYMAKVPQDAPSGSRHYVYATNASRTAYQLLAKLDSQDDPAIDNNKNGTYVPAEDDFPTYGYAICASGAGAIRCNYGISSSNTSMDRDVTTVP